MNKWIISAVVYLALVIGGYWIYDATTVDSVDNHDSNNKGHDITDSDQKGHNDEGSHEDDGSHGHGDDHSGKESEVTVLVEATENRINIALKDKNGNPVKDLEVNHEKLLHLIVVDDHLEDYYHLHPEQTGDGTFTIEQQLPEGNYKAFVDIKPKHLSYHVEPFAFTVGTTSPHGHAELKPDDHLTKVVDGHKVTLIPSSLVAGQNVTLTFDIENAQLQPYLGALGHVVILDAHGEEYLHVHPANDEQPIFETTFPKPGIYKIWAEFKQNDVVTVYPFVVEIK